MKTVRHRGAEIHVGCEGTIVKGTCIRCGEKKPGRSERLFGKEPLIGEKPKFDEAAYKKRIRNMEDLR